MHKKKPKQQLQHSGRFSKTPILVKEEQEVDCKVRLIVPPTSQLFYLNQTLCSRLLIYILLLRTSNSKSKAWCSALEFVKYSMNKE